ncbi:hypothetical protein HDG34_000935 [Paraburkholderia sp. HC6.4b]|uniref:DUF4279 domain-containing protein n=1 Tax=unclassified Paraburkholderia TaxID=2615204 RepID=UPI00160DFBBB|nr:MULTISPECIES: DUF4279 domain-containing protein [unclassified Paraburkholderia]MBB5407012.1 hypothetical protein [Paraburkholderia sp. HC6.4b]MBB5449409.1 hypothetical protein [Paraburkholderia sp. Kb1A]
MAPEHKLAHAAFTIYQDTEPPEFWTNYFGVSPSRAGAKGQPRLMPSGMMSSIPWRQGTWIVSSAEAIMSDDLTPHLRYLVGHLGLPRADLRELIERTCAQMRFFCYWDNESGDRAPDVPDDIRTMMEAMGGTVEIDEYR